MAKEKGKHDGLLCFLLALIVVLILIIGAGAYYFLVVDKPTATTGNEQPVQSNDIKDKISNEVVIENKKTDNIINQEIINILDEIEEKTEKNGVIYELRVSKITKSNSTNNYLITADYNVPIEVTEQQYQNIVKTGKFEDFSGIYKKASDNFGEGLGYGYISIPSQDKEGTIEYEIVKTNIGYAFIYPAGPGYPLNKTEREIEFYLDENDIISVYGEGEKTLKEYSKKLTEDYINTSIITVGKNKDGKILLSISGK